MPVMNQKAAEAAVNQDRESLDAELEAADDVGERAGVMIFRRTRRVTFGVQLAGEPVEDVSHVK